MNEDYEDRYPEDKFYEDFAYDALERQNHRCAGCMDALEAPESCVVRHGGVPVAVTCGCCFQALTSVGRNSATLYQLAALTTRDSRPLVYVIGSLRNHNVPLFADQLRELGSLDVFDAWFSAGRDADDEWRDYEKGRGRRFPEALQQRSAKHVFHFDRAYLNLADKVILVLPAGKSGHLELGYCVGIGKKTAILTSEPDRYDCMYQFADLVTDSEDEIIEWASHDA